MVPKVGIFKNVDYIYVCLYGCMGAHVEVRGQLGETVDSNNMRPDNPTHDIRRGGKLSHLSGSEFSLIQTKLCLLGPVAPGFIPLPPDTPLSVNTGVPYIFSSSD